MPGETTAELRLAELLASAPIEKLIEDVKAAYRTDRLSFKLTGDLDSAHGAFDPASAEPLFEINILTGLTEANLAHELLHALQIRAGFPTVGKGLFTDKRQLVIRELNSNILHIPLVDMDGGARFQSDGVP